MLDEAPSIQHLDFVRLAARLAEVIARLPAIRKAEGEMDRAARDGLRWPAFLRKA